MRIAIWWIRRDVRLHDNAALSAALDVAGQVIPVFIVDPRLLQGEFASPRRAVFLWACLRGLDRDLRERGSRLIVRHGHPETILPELITEVGAQGVFAEEDFTPFARRRDAAVAASVALQLVGGSTIRHPEAVLKDDGTPYTVFTPYMKKWKQAGFPSTGSVLPVPELISTPEGVSSAGVPDGSVELSEAFPAGEAAARQRLHAFLRDRLSGYPERRDRMDLEGTASLSPFFRFGVLSPREAMALGVETLEREGMPDTAIRQQSWFNELIWRDFFASILYHFPQVRHTAFRESLRDIAWREAAEDFEAWKRGMTGVPIVDAGMRQLNAIGWMHNRARMITASFLVKNLLIDWRLGEAWFMQQLLDGDVASNNGGWQWSAGTGTDAAPYFRIFNPVRQGQRFDPAGDYVRRWVPELRAMPAKHIHAPWAAPSDVLGDANVRIGDDYPHPIVDLKASRERALAAFAEARARHNERSK